jgi:hypothetical protein
MVASDQQNASMTRPSSRSASWLHLSRALACTVVVVCTSPLYAQTAKTPQEQRLRHQGHHHEAPHGGTLTEIGDHFAFLELVHDEAAGTLTLYVLDGSAEKAVRVTHTTLMFRLERTRGAAQPIELKARARALTGETVGDTSEFVGTSDLFKGLKTGRGTLAEIVIKGQTLKDLALKWPDDHQ